MHDSIAQEPAAVAPRPQLRAQKIGRRVGVEPYYTISEQTPQRLTLTSRPELNRPTARNFLIVSIVLGLPAVLMLIGGIALVPRIGLAGMLLVIPGLLIGTIALGANTIGRAMRRLVNTIVVDREARTVVYAQQLSAKPPRKQILRFDVISAIQLSRRSVKLAPGLRRRERQLWLLELRTSAGKAWLVDSAADPAALRPTAQALASLLEISVEE